MRGISVWRSDNGNFEALCQMVFFFQGLLLNGE